MTSNTDNTNETPDEYHAAMFVRLGRGTKLSRSGMSVVFDNPPPGWRSDLSSMRDIALGQLQAAGIDPADVTAADLAAYRSWRDALHHARRLGGARIVISATHSHDEGREYYPANTVRLIDGLGDVIGWQVLPRLEYWDRAARNKTGGLGAACYRLDQAGAEQAIADLRARFPEFARAPTQDNSGEFAEARLEDERGAGISHQPGRA